MNAPAGHVVTAAAEPGGSPRGDQPRAGGRAPRERPADRRRRRVVVTVLVVGALALAWATIAFGGYSMTGSDLVRTLSGRGSGAESFVVLRLRLPRLLLGAEVGVAFALAGALFQTVLRNPLASPDIIGVSGGASLAAATAILVGGLSGVAVSLAAFAGAVVVAAAIYLLAWRSGVSGYRFVLIGVGVAFLLNAGLGYLTSRADVNDVREALVWMVGSLGTPPWGNVAVLGVILAVLVPLVALAAPRLRILQLGDDAAGGLGLRVERTRLAVLALGVALAATATAFAGPVAFVAFVCAPVARRMLPGAGLALVPSALVGVVLVLGSDFAAQHLLGVAVPVGIVTGIVGAPYLLWLLATANREGRGA